MTFLNVWVKPKWGTYTLDQVKAVAVEQWLRGLELASKSKLHGEWIHLLVALAANPFLTIKL